MSKIFEKLNLKDQQEILVLNAPESFQPELACLPVLTIHHHIESVAEIGFFLAFVTREERGRRAGKGSGCAYPGRCDCVVCLSQRHIKEIHVRL